MFFNRVRFIQIYKFLNKWTCLTIGCFILLTACTTQNATSNGNSSGAEPPGPHEYGLTMEELINTVDDVESNIAKCMSDAGFEYVAVDFRTVRSAMLADKSLPGLTERQFISRYGYGLSTLYTGLPPQNSGATTPAQIGLGEKNIQIYQNLAPADQVAYNHTLLGESTNDTFAVAIEVEDLSRTGGCTREAIEQVFSAEQLSATYYNPKDALFEQDSRMMDAMVEFTACVREAGFDYDHPDKAEIEIRNRLDEITEGLPLESLSDEAKANLTNLQSEELAVAIVLFECEIKVIDPVDNQLERELYGQRN